MKYGLLSGFVYPVVNFGDYVQYFAIERLYRAMGISEEDICFLSLSEVETYDGETLIVPINFYLSSFISPEGKVKISSKIFPVFLGVTVSDADIADSVDKILTPSVIAYLKMYAPVGCRDWYSCNLLKKYNIPAYVQGCITNIFPERKSGTYTKTILVDCPQAVAKYLPEKLRKNCVILNNSGLIAGKSKKEVWDMVKRQYQYIVDHAAIVVSQRYHIVTPCNAMGIPSIMIKRNMDHLMEDRRLDTLHLGIGLYSIQQLSSIDWNLQAPKFDDLKEAIASLAISRIQHARNLLEGKTQLSALWTESLSRYKQMDFTDTTMKGCIQNFCREYYPAPRRASYYIWGAKPGLCKEDKCDVEIYTKQINSDLVLKGWIDTYSTGTLAQRPIYKPSLSISENEFIILVSQSAIDDFKKYVEINHLQPHQYLICAEQYINAEDLQMGVDGK